MVLEAHQKMTATEFDEWAERQTSDLPHELISGEIFEKIPSNGADSLIANNILRFLFIYLNQNKIGSLTDESGGYKVADDRYAPDVAFMSYARQAKVDIKRYNSVSPDLAIEVISDDVNAQEQKAMRLKITGYLNAGAVVWLVDPDDQTVEIYQAGQNPQVLGINDVLEAPTLLPNFKLPIKDIFED